MAPSDFRSIFEALPEAYLALTQDFLLVGVSDGFLRATGMRREAMLGHDLFAALPGNPNNPSARLAWRASLVKVLATGIADEIGPVAYRVPGPYPSGGSVIKQWRLVTTPTLDQAGHGQHLLVRAEEVAKKAASLQRDAEKRANLSAEAAEQKLADMLESMNDAFFSVDKNWVITRVNANQERIAQLPREQQIGKNVLELFFSDPSSRKKYWDAYHRAMTQRVAVSFDDYYAPLDLWTSVDAYPTADGGLAIFYRDITAERFASRQVEAERHKFEAIFVDSPAPMALLRGNDLIFEQVNPKYIALMGGRQLQGKALCEALPELEGQPFPALMRKVFATGEAFHAREMVARLIRRPNGEPEDTYFDFSYTRVEDGDGNPYGIYIHAMDITDKVLARKKVEESQERLHRLLETLPVPFCITDLSWRVTYINPSALSFFEMAREDMMQRCLWDLFLNFENTSIARHIKRAKDENRQTEHEGYYPELDKWYHVWAYPFDDGTAIVFTDVTAQVLARRYVEDLAADLQGAVRVRDEFLSIASHELKTPVTSLKMQLQMTRRAVKPAQNIAPAPEKLAKTLDLATRQVDRLTALIEALLDVSRIESGKMTYNFEPVELNELVSEVVERFSEQLKSVNCPLEMITCAEPVTVVCDRFRVEQIVTNLLTNAIKYGAGSLVHVSVLSCAEGGSICVRDSGMGIAHEKQSQIFNRFERAVSHRNISGLGLGLYIAKSIVDAHAGTISVVSELGKGSAFTLILPWRQVQPEPSSDRSG